MFSSLYAGIGGAASLLPSKKDTVATSSALTARASGPARAFAGADVHDSSYYSKCMMGGILSCGLTHTAIVPLDVVKCRMQTNPAVYTGVFQGFRVLGQEGGYTVGWLPTLIGYSMQGFCKFGFYEIFKDVYSGMFDADTAFQYRAFIFAAASASAEFIADVALCPMESVKVRMQTAPKEMNFPTSLGAAVARIKGEEGLNGFFKGLGPLWGRQVPYTVVKFVAFEKIVEAFYTKVFTAPKDSYSKGTQLGITFASGYIAGVFCAVVSHPADTIVSKLNQNPTGGIKAIVDEMGLMQLATKGLMARIIMIGTLTGLQWWIYDSFKTAVGLQTTGGGKK